MKLTRKQLNIEVKDFNEADGTIRAVIASGMPDRDGDMIDNSSWLLEEYHKNPVVLWAHDHSQPAVGKALSIGLNSDGMLEALIQFAVNEYDYAKTLFKLYAGGFMRAFSVGFIPGVAEVIDGINILKNNSLYEFSAVNVGADALALAKQKGIDTSSLEEEVDEAIEEEVEEVFEKEGRVLSAKNRKVIESAHKALGDVLNADHKETPKYNKMNYRKMVNRAIRDLIETKRNTL